MLKSVDQAAEVTLPNNANVYELKKAVKAEFAATLQHVDAGELQVFLSCDTELTSGVHPALHLVHSFAFFACISSHQTCLAIQGCLQAGLY